jgi:hypothetical protein
MKTELRLEQPLRRSSGQLPQRARRVSAWAAAFTALGLLLAPAIATAQEAPAPQAKARQADAQDTASSRIVVVEWRIKKGREQDFLDYWSTKATVSDRTGLVGEFLSRVEDRNQFPWMVWDLDPGWTTFLNVGFWRNGSDFQEQIGRFIDNSKPPLDFEAQKRRRVLVAPERWRVGETPFPTSDAAGVK